MEMKTGIMIGEAMTRHPVSVSSSATIAMCAILMTEKSVGSLLIKDNGELKGIVTEQDIVRKAVARSTRPQDMTVADVMEKDLVTINGKEDIFDAIMLMRKHDIRHLPVVVNGSLEGFVTLKDILRIEPELFELMVDRLDIREEAHKPISRPKPNEGICQQCGEYAEELFAHEEGNLLCEPCKDGLLMVEKVSK